MSVVLEHATVMTIKSFNAGVAVPVFVPAVVVNVRTAWVIAAIRRG